IRYLLICCFFFSSRRRHTRSKRDWSSDVCSSDLVVLMIALSLYIKYSRMGRASRASSQDLGMANMLGIDTNRVISFTFVVGAMRSEERRVGKECRSRRAREREKKHKAISSITVT